MQSISCDLFAFSNQAFKAIYQILIDILYLYVLTVMVRVFILQGMKFYEIKVDWKFWYW